MPVATSPPRTLVFSSPSRGLNTLITQQASPVKPHYCPESERLLEAFGQTVQELTILHEQQFIAVLNGEADFPRFDLLIHMATEKKQQAKYDYLQHIEEHGC